ncbi:MAG TPA: uroporphyrinogen-III synthase, partial [Actinomycetota bacterium]
RDPRRGPRRMTGLPLAGRTIVLTRPAERSAHLVELIAGLGGRVLLAPSIELKPARSAALTQALRDLAAGRFTWVVLTSPSTVAMLADRLASPADVRARVAAIGDGTAAAFTRYAGRAPDLRPRTFTTEGLARAFPRGEGRVLCPRADIAPEGLEDALTAKGWTPLRVDAYRTSFPRALQPEAAVALSAGEVDAVTFTSASTVRGFVGALGEVRGSPKVVCIGPVTAKEARAHGLVVHAVADPHTTEGVVEALVRVLRRRGT